MTKLNYNKSNPIQLKCNLKENKQYLSFSIEMDKTIISSKTTSSDQHYIYDYHELLIIFLSLVLL